MRNDGAQTRRGWKVFIALDYVAYLAWSQLVKFGDRPLSVGGPPPCQNKGIAYFGALVADLAGSLPPRFLAANELRAMPFTGPLFAVAFDGTGNAPNLGIWEQVSGYFGAALADLAGTLQGVVEHGLVLVQRRNVHPVGLFGGRRGDIQPHLQDPRGEKGRRARGREGR